MSEKLSVLRMECQQALDALMARPRPNVMMAAGILRVAISGDHPPGYIDYALGKREDKSRNMSAEMDRDKES